MEIDTNIYVKDIYEQIAHRFNQTRGDVNKRKTYWKSIKSFIDGLPSQSLILDCGCGNGKHMLLRNDCTFLGFDFCVNNTLICKDKGLNVIINDILNISFRTNAFDCIICVAVIHHLSTFENRIKSMNELSRVTKKDGLMFIQVWATTARNDKQFIHIKDNDYFVTWYIDKDTKVKRYYHLFEKEELIKLCEICNIKILNIYFELNNWILIGKK